MFWGKSACVLKIEGRDDTMNQKPVRIPVICINMYKKKWVILYEEFKQNAKQNPHKIALCLENKSYCHIGIFTQEELLFYVLSLQINEFFVLHLLQF